MRPVPLIQFGYTGHVDSVVHPNGDTYHAVGHNVNIGGKNRRNLLIMHRNRAGEWRTIKEYVEDKDYPGPLGACALCLIKTGNMLVLLCRGNEKDQVWLWEDTIPNCHPPY